MSRRYRMLTAGLLHASEVKTRPRAMVPRPPMRFLPYSGASSTCRLLRSGNDRRAGRLRPAEPARISAALGESPELVTLRTEALAGMALFEDCPADQLVAVAERFRPLVADPGEGC